jgi:hypothetical protein
MMGVGQVQQFGATKPPIMALLLWHSIPQTASVQENEKAVCTGEHFWPLKMMHHVQLAVGVGGLVNPLWGGG